MPNCQNAFLSNFDRFWNNSFHNTFGSQHGFCRCCYLLALLQKMRLFLLTIIWFLSNFMYCEYFIHGQAGKRDNQNTWMKRKSFVVQQREISILYVASQMNNSTLSHILFILPYAGVLSALAYSFLCFIWACFYRGYPNLFCIQPCIKSNVFAFPFPCSCRAQWRKKYLFTSRSVGRVKRCGLWNCLGFLFIKR